MVLSFNIKSQDEAPVRRVLDRMTLFLGLLLLAALVTFCFFASLICITVILAAFLAILIDPLVERAAKARLGRPLASGIVIVCGMVLVGLAGYGVYQKGSTFADEFPAYSEKVRQTLDPINAKFQRLQKNAEAIAPVDGIRAVKIQETPSWPSFLVRGIGSISSGLVVAGVVPFLCFFMLIEKEQLFKRFENIFGNNLDVPKFVWDLNRMVRGFVMGNLIAGSMMAAVTTAAFYFLGMKDPLTLGIITTFLNLIPFVGAVAATFVAFAAALGQFNTLLPFVLIFLTILIVHLIGANVLTPRTIGSRVSVGPVAVTIGMLFWGWLWGVMGLLLAVPLTGFIKLVADSQPSLAHLSGILEESPPILPRLPRWAGSDERSRHVTPSHDLAV